MIVICLHTKCRVHSTSFRIAVKLKYEFTIVSLLAFYFIFNAYTEVLCLEGPLYTTSGLCIKYRYYGSHLTVRAYATYYLLLEITKHKVTIPFSGITFIKVSLKSSVLF